MIEIDCRDRISESVAFLVDGKHFVNSGVDGKIRRWRVEDGKEVGIPMEVGNAVLDIALSRDGKWVVSGTIGEGVTVWNAESHEKVPIGFKTDPGLVFAIDVSPDGTRIASGSGDLTACVWSLSTGEQLLGPLQHDNVVVGIKFSPDGRLLATVTEDHCNAIRIYDSQTGCLLFDFPITISDAASNHSLAWAGDSKQLFALSRDNIYCLDASDGTTLSHWPIHSRYPPVSIALAGNGTFIAVAADTSVSFWDTTTYERIGSVIERTALVVSMAISTNYDIVVSTGAAISVVGLYSILPLKYLDGIVRDGETFSVSVDLEKIELPRTQTQDKDSNIPHLEQEIARVNEENAHLKEAMQSLLADMSDLRDTVQNLRTELTGFKHKTDLTISSLRARCVGRKLRQKNRTSGSYPRERSPQLDTPDHTMD